MDTSTHQQWTDWRAPGWRETVIVTPQGRRYRLAVAAPDAPAPPEGFASLFVLDGVQHFAAVAAAATALARRSEKTRVGPLVVVGVFHDTPDGKLDGDLRMLDFTDGPPPDGEMEGRPHGRAETFRRMLEDQAIPAAEALLSLNPARRTLFGHSLGGLFTVETLNRRPDLFASGVAISPSLWWRPDLERPAAPLMVGVGELETGRDLRARLEAWAGDALIVAPTADHGAAPFALIPHALRHISAG